MLVLVLVVHVNDAEFKVEAATAELHLGNERVETELVEMHHVLSGRVATAITTRDNVASCSSMRLRRRCIVCRNFGLGGSECSTFSLLSKKLERLRGHNMRKEESRGRVAWVHTRNIY
jgi:hypothetical protein